jgi:hypothetical protein
MVYENGRVSARPGTSERTNTGWIACLAMGLVLFLLTVLSGANLFGTVVRTNS